MAKRRYRKRAKSVKTDQRVNASVAGAETEPLTTKVYASPNWPAIKIGRHVKFEDGWFVTNDADLQSSIERSDGYGHAILDVTKAVDRKRQIGSNAKLFVSFRDKSLTIEQRLTFSDGIYTTNNPDLQRLIEQFPAYGRREIREIKNDLVLKATAANEKSAQAVA